MILHVRPLALHRHGDPGDQPAAADRHDDRLDIRHLLENLQPHRPLPRDDRRVVEAMDVNQPMLLDQLLHAPSRFGKCVAAQDHVRPEIAARRHLDQRRKPRHDHRHADAQELPVIRQPQRMIARRSGDDAALRSSPSSSNSAFRAPRSLKLPVRCR